MNKVIMQHVTNIIKFEHFHCREKKKKKIGNDKIWNMTLKFLH